MYKNSRIVLLLTAAFFAVTSASAAVHYVSAAGTATWAQCTDINTPCSLPTANANCIAGDTVYLRGGSYSAAGYINPARSGTGQNTGIVYSNYNGEKVIIRDGSDGIYLYKKSYITVYGIDFENLNRFIRIYAGHYNTIGYCTFNQRNPASGEWAGVIIADDPNDTTTACENSTFNRVHHCSFFRWAYGTFAEHRGGILDIGSWALHPVDESSGNLIEYNTFAYGGHHTLGVYSRNNVIRGNFFHNETSPANWAFEGYRDAITEGPVGGYCVYENNRFAFALPAASGLALRTHHNILRRNDFYCNGLGAIQVVRSDTSDLADSNHIYHNNFFRNGHGADYTGFSGGVYFCDWGNGDPIGNAVKNNIFYDNKGGAITTDAVATPQVVERNWETGDPLFVDDESPLDTLSPNLPDFHLQKTSLCIDSGTYLTKISSMAGSGMKFQVEDAAYFMDGWGVPGVGGDEIQLFGTGQKARITAVDYQTNTLTVDKSLSWTQNQGICLAYIGSAPDIGAHEYDQVGISVYPGAHGIFPILKCCPNPFRQSAVIRYRVSQPGLVNLTIYTMSGRLVKSLACGKKKPGEYKAVWDGRDENGMKVTAGVYYCRLNRGGFVRANRMVLMR